LGQPLHAFDLDKLGGSAIVVRAAREGELLRTLDGENRRLSKGMLAICDETDPVAIAGVMGGQDSEVSGETTDVLLECALFDPKSVRATRNALGMSTDASFRFERGVDPEGMERAVRRAVEVILATSGGEPDPEILDVCPRPWLGLKVPLRPSRVEHVLGISLSSEEIADLLKPLGFEVVQASPDTLDVAVPGFRSYDVVREVDLVEEVARTYGYDRFPSDMGPFRPGTVPDHALFHLEDELRNLLVGEGFLEAQTMAFVSQEYGEVELSNPVSAEEGFLRAALLPGLLRRVEYNFARGGKDLRLFEIGTVFFDRGPDLSPAEETRLALVLTGGRAPLHWEGEGEPVDVWDLKGLLARLVPAARLKSAVVQEGFSDHGELVPGERFAVYGEGEALLGRAGRVDPITVDAPAWAGPVWGLELVLPADPEPAPVPVHEPPPAFPGVDRDLALVLPKALPARQVEDVIRSASGPLMVDLQIFDLFEGAGIPEGMRSVAFRLRFQSRERTLTDEDVERSVARVADRLREELGVETRG
jgi:phenylalanyl-tRNA synthetase beta chain